MKKTLILMAAASAFVLTGCTESDLSGDTSLAKESAPSAIEFSANTRNAGTTRAGYAGDLTNTTIKEATAGFGVFAYYSGSQTIKNWGAWDGTATPPVAINQAPNFMYNEKLTWTGASGTPANVWNYSPVKYWPNGVDAANNANSPSNTATEANPQYLSFFAYAPYVKEGIAYDKDNQYIGGDLPSSAVGSAVFTYDAAPTAVQNGIVAMSKNDDAKDMHVKYILNPGADGDKKFVDLTWGVRGKLTYNQTSTTTNTVATLGSAYNNDLTKQPVDEKVTFLFKHALARVGGNTSTTASASGNQICGLWVVADIDKNSSVAGAGQSAQTNYFSTDFDNQVTLVTIEEVKIQDNYSYNYEKNTSTDATSDFLTDGWFDIMNGTWTDTKKVLEHTTDQKGVIYNVDAKNSGSPAYSLNPDIMEPTTAVSKSNISTGKWNITGTTGVTTTKKQVYKADEDVPGLLLIPGTTGSNTLYITVTYKVRTVDSKLSTGFSEVAQTITNKVSLSNDILNPNKYYNLVMHLGLTSVKFEAVVANWENGDGEYKEDGGEKTPGDGIDNSVWLPSNVISNSVIAKANTINTSINVPADQTSYTIFVSGLTAGNTVTVEGTNNASGKVQVSPSPVGTDGFVTVTVQNMDPNTANTTTENVITITEKDGESNTVTTTKVTLVQAGVTP